MSLEEFSPSESPEAGANAAEISEKLKDAIKRGTAGIKRTQKDEKKAKKYDMLLAGFLVKIIIDKKYDWILESLFSSLDKGFSSNLVLWILSLSYEEISEKIRSSSGKDYAPYTFKYSENTEFNDSTLDPQVKQRINFWVEDISDIITLEYSNIQIQELQKNFILNKNIIISFTAKVFQLFLQSSNITATPVQLASISEFILWEIESEIKKLEIEEI